MFILQAVKKLNWAIAVSLSMSMTLANASGAAPINGAVSVVGTLQNTKIVEYPDMSLNHMDYRGLVVEYAVGGEASVTQLKKITTAIPCDGGNKNIEQLEVNYQSPKILVRVKDTTRDTLKFLGQVPREGAPSNTGKTIYGRATCDSVDNFASLSTEFAAKRANFLSGISQKVHNDAPALVQDFVTNNTVVKFRPVEFTSFQFKSAGTEFTAINQAYDIATKAYDMIQEKDVLIEPSEGIKGAVELWEMAIGNPILNARPDAKILKAAIAYNLSSAYLISMNYMQASAYHKLAVILNNDSGNTLKLPDHQAIIDRQLRNRSISNTVPNNLVALITLERMGSEYLKHAEITPLSASGFAELQAQVGQLKTASVN